MNDQNTHDIREVEKRVLALERGQKDMRSALEENTRVTNSIKADTAGLVDFAQSAESFIKVGRIIGRVLKWLAPIAAAALAFWATIKGRQP